jgi:hypothetical protein
MSSPSSKSPVESDATVPHGAYGLRLRGLATPSLLAAPASWSDVAVVRRPLEDAPTATRVEADRADLVFANRWGLRLVREPACLEFFVPPDVEDEELVHPYLAPAALRFAGWHGAAALHAGAFVTGAGAWGLLAGRGGGKSTTLARLAERGVEVLADDLLVVGPDGALAGPRCIDLRLAAAAVVDRALLPVREGERRRLSLGSVAPCVPLRGFFVLEWGEALSVRELHPGERLSELARRFRTGEDDPARLLELATLPAWRLVRPRAPTELDAVCEQLLTTARD